MSAPEQVVHRLRAAEASVGTAESLTGGLVAAGLTSVPGSSEVVRGAVVAYAREVKQRLLGVPEGLLDRHGAVAAETALAMADGARRVLGADWGVATTGVAGPDPSEGKPVGTVHVAVTGSTVTGDERRATRTLRLRGTREEIRAQTVRHALDLLAEVLSGQ